MAGEIDLTQFHEVFFEESFEGVTIMESGLLELDPDAPNVETINNVFRAAHSIKGGAGTFGFNEVSEFTHKLESLLDGLRAGQMAITDDLVQLLLESVDFLRHLLQSCQAGKPVDPEQIEVFAARLLDYQPEAPAAEAGDVSDQVAAPAASDEPTSQPEPDAGPASQLSFVLRAEAGLLRTGNDPARLLRDLAELGELKVSAQTERLPDYDAFDPESCYLDFAITLTGSGVREADVREVFSWVEDEVILDFATGSLPADNDPAATAQAMTSNQPDNGIDLPEAPAEDMQTEAPLTAASEEVDESAATGLRPEQSETIPAPEAEDFTSRRAGATPDAPQFTPGVPEVTSIRVNIDRVDMLVNLVGELVITQSMLSRFKEGEAVDVEELARGIEQLEENTRELQEQTMRIRMLPIDNVFQRMPRLVRDLGKSLEKEVELKINGKSTEVDKTVLEKITDPLTHLIRNSLDHGIESPVDRKRAGKSATGVIEISAFHEGGSIIIQVQDDGRGLNRPAILAKAVEKGIIDADAELTEAQIDQLIFSPGFSTAIEVSDVSGRGVGMDVVKNNIEQLNGHIDVRSVAGEGCTFTVKLPLTLAIIEGQLVRVGRDVFIIPLLSIVKSTRIGSDEYNLVGGDSMMFRLEEDYLPVIPLKDVYHIRSDYEDVEEAILVIVDAVERYGILVDEVLGQQQVVVKSLETNFKEVPTISGATILGDGTVAMIMDMAGLLRESRREQQPALAD